MLTCSICDEQINKYPLDVKTVTALAVIAPNGPYIKQNIIKDSSLQGSYPDWRVAGALMHLNLTGGVYSQVSGFNAGRTEFAVSR